VTARSSPDIVAAGSPNEIGNPVASQIWRIQPFEAEYSWFGGRPVLPEAPQPSFQVRDQLLCPILEIESPGDAAYVTPDALEIPGSEREHLGRFRHCGGEAMYLAVTHGAHLTEILGEDQVGSEPPDHRTVDRDYRTPGIAQRANLGVDGFAVGPVID